MTEEPNKITGAEKGKYREEAIRDSEARYRSLFEDSPISLWEEDFSDVKTHIDYLRAKGIKDFQGYFDEHPEEVSKCANLVRINDVNKATLELLEAKSKEDLFAGLSKIFTIEALDIFKEELISLCEGGQSFESEAPHRTLKGNIKIVHVRLTLVPEYRKNWSKVFISLANITELKKVEKNLRIKENAIDSSINAVAIADLTGKLTYINPSFLEMWGYSNEKEVLGRKAINFWQVENKASEVINAVKKKGNWLGELLAKRKDGSTFNVQLSANIVNDEEGNPISLLASFVDITEQLRAEEKLRESEDKFRTIAEQGLMGVTIFQNNLVKYVNNQFADTLGYSVEEILNWNPGEWWKTMHPDDMSFVLDQIKRKQNEIDTDIRHYIARGIHKSGRILWFEVWLKKIIYQKKKAILATYIDITEKTTSEEKLKESEEKYRTLFQNSPFSIVVIDKEGYIRDFNPAFEELSGYNREELIGKKYSEISLIPKKHLPILLKRQEKLLKGQTIPLIELQIKKKNKRLRWINFTSNLINLDNKTFIQLIGHDITDRKKAQQELINAYDRTNFYKDLFAHDMKNILHSISSSIEVYSLIKDTPEKQNEIDELFEIIEDQTKRGVLLISNVNKLSKIEEAKGSIKQVEILPILHEAIEFLKNSFQNRKLDLKLNIKDNKNYFGKANALLLDVFENLLINSVKHNDHSKVEIEIQISNELKRKKNYVKIQFIDNGKGIPDARKETIFQRNAERALSGMGLGLSLVKFIIDSYDGDILVKNRIRGDYTKGSNFTIFIPEA